MLRLSTTKPQAALDKRSEKVALRYPNTAARHRQLSMATRDDSRLAPRPLCQHQPQGLAGSASKERSSGLASPSSLSLQISTT